MDANGLRFWMLSEPQHWIMPGDPPSLEYDRARRILRLADQRPSPDWPANEAIAAAQLDRVPQAIDDFGTRAYWSADTGMVMTTGAVAGEIPIFSPPVGAQMTDLAMGYDGILYIAIGGAITLLDLRGRWKPVSVEDTAFKAWRLAADPAGGVWALDLTKQKLARVQGQPSAVRPHPPFNPGTFRPCPENPDPPRLQIKAKATWPAQESAVALAVNPDGRLALLTWSSSGFAKLRLLAPSESFSSPKTLLGAQRPFSLAWVSSGLIAVLLASLNEAPVYPVDETGDNTQPMGEIYPLRDHDGGPFLHGTKLPPQYPSASGPLPLYPLSLPSYAANGEASNALILDSGSTTTAWHRLYLEAAIPPHCGIGVRLAAANSRDAEIADKDWCLSMFGQFSPAESDVTGGVPVGAWVPSASEVPLSPALLPCPPEKDRVGLFTVLIQRPGRVVRSLRGRYLMVRMELQGRGHSTPEVAALRAYASRFSYVDHYLPELYREDTFPPDADESGPSTRADFLERFLNNFEGILTPIEDRVASSYLVTDARTTPDEALDWLGSWIGVTFDSVPNVTAVSAKGPASAPAYAMSRRRELLQAAPELFRFRGTLRSLTRALDVATGNAVSTGQIVILENFRLRRTLATILGANLADETDPLTGGLSQSGNSFVGDTLFLGDENRKEFLALFGADLPSPSEQAAVEAFFDGLAYRVTVLVHQDVSPQNLGLIRRIVELETPAHILATVQTASYSFVAGLASLVGVDTYLAPKLGPRAVRVDVSQIGVRDLIERVPALDPRLGGDERQLTMEPPEAEVKTPVRAEFGQSFILDGSASHASEGRKIVRYIWTRIN
jgi:phage tail-like protein